MSKKPLFVKCMTPPFTASFVNIEEPSDFQGDGRFKWSVTALFDKEAQATPEYKKMREAVVAVMEHEHGKDRKKWPKGCKMPFTKVEDMEKTYSGYEPGMVVVSLSLPVENRKGKKNKQPQVLCKKDGNITNDTDKFYAGCFARAIAQAHWYSMGSNKGVKFRLENIQKLDDGERLDGASDPYSDFGLDKPSAADTSEFDDFNQNGGGVEDSHEDAGEDGYDI